MSKKQEPWRVYISREGTVAGLACNLLSPEAQAVWPTLGDSKDLKELRGLCRLLNKREALLTLIREDNAGLLAEIDAASFMLSRARIEERRRWAQYRYEREKTELYKYLFPWGLIFNPVQAHIRKEAWKFILDELELQYSREEIIS